MARESMSKKTRFEIFKRDSFTCQYCGKQPPEVVLVIDHINPVKEGGDNDELNLVTACEACNQGKGARKLDTMSNRPDADLKWLEMQQEIGELKRYQKAKEERDKIYDSIIDGFQQSWWSLLGNEVDAPSHKLFLGLLKWASPNQIDRSIEIMAQRSNNIFGFDRKFKYLCGILHHIVDRESEEWHAEE